MASEELTKQLIDKTVEVYKMLTDAKDENLSRQEIIEAIGKDLEPYYTNVVQGLADLKLAVRKRGFYGGVSLPGTGEPPRQELTDDDKEALRKLFADGNLKPTAKIKDAASEEEEERLEKEFYRPLKDYLEKSGLYEIVVINSKISGTKWENADLATVSFERDLRFHSHIDLRMTAVEVKRHFPTAENLQQAASYLVYANASYLCYFDSQFRGKDIDTAVQRLRDQGIWDLAETFGVGLIVSYYAQEGGKKLYFQTVRHIPYKESAPIQVERGIELWLDDTARRIIKKAYVRHIQRLQSGLD